MFCELSGGLQTVQYKSEATWAICFYFRDVLMHEHLDM